MNGAVAGPWRQWRRAGVAFAVVAVATLGVAGAELRFGDPRPSGHVVRPAPTATPTTPGTGTPSPTTQPDPPPAFRCWTGARVATLDDCSDPTGAAGLAWVFPSLDLDACTDRLVTEESPMLRQLYECRVPVAGRTVTVAYAEWRSAADALDYYDAQSPRRVSIRGKGGRPLRFGWLDVTASGAYTGALAYTDAPFSVAVTAPDEATRIAAAHDVVRLRPTAELRGVPLGDPPEGPVTGSRR